ncbi:MAG TPA: hypothetical protein VLB79_06925 [Solirubrobacterales bacterium]|nr:hypothetical protein [Solirubrobacterales bacterium]
MGLRKAAGLWLLLALMACGLAACGSGDETTTTTARPAVSRTTADHLAKLSNRIASDLDAGDLCHAAHAADDLSTAVEDSDLPANLRPGVETVATELVNQVNCPPPPPPPPPAPEKPKKPEEKKPDEHGKGHGNEQGNGNGNEHGKGNSKHGGFVPPGQAKLKGGG